MFVTPPLILESIIAAPPPKIKQNRAHGCNIGPLPSPSRDQFQKKPPERSTCTLAHHAPLPVTKQSSSLTSREPCPHSPYHCVSPHPHAIIKEYGSVLYIMTASLCFFQASEKKIKMKPYFHILLLISFATLLPSLFSIISRAGTRRKVPDNETIYRVPSSYAGAAWPVARILVCPQFGEGSQMGAAIYMGLQPGKLRQMWAGQGDETARWSILFRRTVQAGENIYWGNGDTWTPTDAVRAWADEEKYYRYATNTCEVGEICGHYTQIVWRNTRRIGCARVVCDSGDVFMTCNYDPVGNYIGERPYDVAHDVAIIKLGAPP
ncbi:Pathogenesis-related protein PR-1 [Vitis vinifera]|uniref:Pathogenesis-related protein PR-1 n=1 Tax=Vitis vinifera TaxID=29760 RepID=A0A438D2X8_VITVI|nr:Pathogenesis-related protein PR-1 [Vitis vinifera]